MRALDVTVGILAPESGGVLAERYRRRLARDSRAVAFRVSLIVDLEHLRTDPAGAHVWLFESAEWAPELVGVEVSAVFVWGGGSLVNVEGKVAIGVILVGTAIPVDAASELVH